MLVKLQMYSTKYKETQKIPDIKPKVRKSQEEAKSDFGIDINKKMVFSLREIVTLIWLLIDSTA